MSNRRAQSLPPPHILEPPKRERGRCVAAICFSWKVLTCVVSHVTLVLLVVSYCVGGAYLFQYLEKPHEIEVKKEIQYIRSNLTERIWRFSDNLTVLNEENWMKSVKKDLTSFEKQLQMAIKADGWDGDEDVTKTQWTFAGSLFYSIIVITTIGYGHISPRTDWGKVTTIFYAIVGIPLMLLCLSTIGDVMATSFRFIYWRICCYVCTRTSRPRVKHRGSSMRVPHRNTSRSQPPAFRRSMRLTQRSGNDSGFGNSAVLPHAYSDPELPTIGRNDYERGRDFDYGRSGRSSGGRQKGRNQLYERGGRGNAIYEDDYDIAPQYTQTLNRGSRFSGRQRNRDRMRDRHTVERERYSSRSKQCMDGSFDDFSDMQPPAKRAMSVRSMRSPQIQNNDPMHHGRDTRALRELNRLNSQLQTGHGRVRPVPNVSRGRAKSVDPRASGPSTHYEDVDEEIVRKTPIISNRYALDDFGSNRNHNRPKYEPRSQSMPRSAHQRFHNGGRDVRGHSPQPQRRASLGRQQSCYGNHLELPGSPEPAPHRIRKARSPRHNDYDFDDSVFEDDYEQGVSSGPAYEEYPRRHNSRRHERKSRRERQERLPPSPRIMSPMGFPVQRQIRRRPSFDYDEDSGDEYGDYYGDISPKDRPVPIWLCVFLVISYILGGAVLFAYWEQWSFLDSAYFCFITLTTIGFGDFVPAKGVKDESEQSIAYCSLYLLFGIALLAMSFNLVQEEFIANVKEVAKRLGILKDEEDDD